MERLHKATMLKMAREHGQVDVYASGNKVNAFHINDGWMLGYPITITARKDSDGTWLYNVEGIDGVRGTLDLNTYCDNILYYLNSELGNRVIFWID